MDRRHRALALAVGSASLLDSAGIIAVGLGLALWRDTFGLGVWGVGAISASMTCSIAVGALVGGRVADLLGRGRTFTWSLVAYAVGSGLVAVAPSPEVLVAGVVVMGAASGADLPASLATLADHAPAGSLGRLVAGTHVLWTVGVLLTSTAGLALSTHGTGGIRVVFGGLAVLALVTTAVRALHPALRGLRPPAPAHGPATRARAVPLRRLAADRTFLEPLLLTGGFYALYTLVASTFGSFKTYFLISVGGATQTTATAVITATGLLGLAGTVVFAALADTAWRHRLFPVGMTTYAVALGLVVVTGGTALPVVVVALVLQNLSFPFVGDAIYKVWTQESFAPDVRATAQGATIAVARGLAAAFALVTPALLAWSPGVLFALLLVALAAATVVGLAIRERAPARRTAIG